MQGDVFRFGDRVRGRFTGEIGYLETVEREAWGWDVHVLLPAHPAFPRPVSYELAEFLSKFEAAPRGRRALGRGLAALIPAGGAR
jgi:hypothetical protein